MSIKTDPIMSHDQSEFVDVWLEMVSDKLAADDIRWYEMSWNFKIE